jgi:hypothetical protein
VIVYIYVIWPIIIYLLFVWVYPLLAFPRLALLYVKFQLYFLVCNKLLICRQGGGGTIGGLWWGVYVGEDGLVWLLFSICYVLVTGYYYIVYGVICFSEIVV